MQSGRITAISSLLAVTVGAATFVSLSPHTRMIGRVAMAGEAALCAAFLVRAAMEYWSNRQVERLRFNLAIALFMGMLLLLRYRMALGDMGQGAEGGMWWLLDIAVVPAIGWFLYAVRSPTRAH